MANIAEHERDKYASLWRNVPEYRSFSPGLQAVPWFEEMAQPKPGSSIIDLGCGAGVAGLELQRRGYKAWYIDITDAALEDEIPRERFIHAALWDSWQPSPEQWDYGFSCDVMEHLPPEYTMLAVDRILAACKIAFFQIALQDESFGLLGGQPLHLTVRPYMWWLERLRLAGNVIDARDLCERSVFLVTR